jgi:hypothetical protein
MKNVIVLDVGLVKTDVSEKCVAYIFRAENLSKGNPQT